MRRRRRLHAARTRRRCRASMQARAGGRRTGRRRHRHGRELVWSSRSSPLQNPPQTLISAVGGVGPSEVASVQRQSSSSSGDQQEIRCNPRPRGAIFVGAVRGTWAASGGELHGQLSASPCNTDGEHEVGRFRLQLERRWGELAGAQGRRPTAAAGLHERGQVPARHEWGGWSGLELKNLNKTRSNNSQTLYVEQDRENVDHHWSPSQGTEDWSQIKEDRGAQSQFELNVNRS